LFTIELKQELGGQTNSLTDGVDPDEGPHNKLRYTEW